MTSSEPPNDRPQREAARQNEARIRLCQTGEVWLQWLRERERAPTQQEWELRQALETWIWEKSE